MIRLTIAVLVAGIAWGGYWFIGAAAREGALTEWFAARQADGWVAEYADLRVRGFPNRFDATLTEPVLADPDTGLLWSAPFVQIFALSYRPDHLIAVWPNRMQLASPRERIDIVSGDMRASLVVAPGGQLDLSRMVLVAEQLGMTSDRGWRAQMSELRLAADRTGDVDATDQTYHLGLQARDLRPAAEMRLQLDPDEVLPRALRSVTVDADVTFDAAWDRRAIEQARPQPRRIDLTLAEAEWGDLRLAAAGQLEVDGRGRPEGEITLKARNWAEILELGVNSGAVTEGLAAQLGTALDLISRMSGDPRTLDIPLRFRGGTMYVGPLPVGDAPVLRLR